MKFQTSPSKLAATPRIRRHVIPTTPGQQPSFRRFALRARSSLRLRVGKQMMSARGAAEHGNFPVLSRSSPTHPGPSVRASPAPASASAQPLQQPPDRGQSDIPPSGTDHTLGIHQLRSTTQYRHVQQYVPRDTKLLKAFNAVYVPFRDNKPIPMDARQKLEEFQLTSDDFYRLVTARELPKARFIYLDQGKIRFDECTLPPHGQVIVEIVVQIALQDRPFGLFDGTTGEGTHDHFLSLLMGCRCPLDSWKR